MKKIILFLVLVISVLSVGLTIYYFSIDNEVISIRSSYLVVDTNDSIATSDLLSFKNKSKTTQFEYSSTDVAVLEYNKEGSSFVAKSAGTCEIVVNTTNRLYSKLSITVRVCDGSSTSPYQISSESKLKKIGQDENYPLDAHYVLTSDILLAPIVGDEGVLDGTWTPIENFSGVFDGAFHTIYNMKITDSTLKDGKNAGFFGSLVNNIKTEDNVNMTNEEIEPEVKSSGIVKNLILKDLVIDVTTADTVGSIVAKNNGEIHTSTAFGSIKSQNDNAFVGGVVGSSTRFGARPVIDRCGFEGNISTVGSTSTVGGIVGYNKSGNVSECYVVTGNKTIENGESGFGGIVGKNEGNNEKANVYDNFFYMNLLNEQTTDFENFAGVIYENVNTVTSNNVLGNYFGGIDELERLPNVKNGVACNTRFNSNLTREQFANQSIAETKFINYISTDEVERIWAFATVWSLGQNYPILNIHSASGSIYTDDIDIIPDTVISNADEFLDAVLGLKDFESKLFSITASEIDLEGKVIGSSAYPIPSVLLNLSNDEIGSLISTNGTTIKNLTIHNNLEDADVGLARLMTKNTYVSGITFENVNIIGEKGRHVGVLAGSSEGASVRDVNIRNVSCNIDGTSFGGLFGLYRNTSGHSIQNVNIYNISCENNRYIFSGGVVGYNYGNIIGNSGAYSTVNIAKLSGNYTGGVVGVSKENSSISNYNVNNISFDQPIENNTQEGKIYSGDTNVSGNGDLFLGGVAGRNYGVISNVYANSRITAYAYDSSLSDNLYSVYAGGIAGINQNNISHAYVSSTSINVIKNGDVYVGGLVGFNYSAVISQCVVDRNTTLEADTTVTIPPTDDNTFEYIGLSMVGGLVGYDYYTNLDYSIYQCVSMASRIKGFYSAGLVAIEFGNMLECECGDLTKADGNVTITGFMSAGLSVLLKAGFIKDCYTACKLQTVQHSGTYEDIHSVAGRRVSGTAGLILIADANATIRGCYTLASFNSANTVVSFATRGCYTLASFDSANTGVSFATFGYSKNAFIVGNIYLNEGSKPGTAGKRLTDSELRGSDNYAKFMSNIGSEDNRVWSTEYGYPVIKAIDERNNDRVTPNYLG